MTRQTAFLGVIVAVLGVPTLASADDSIVVLGLQSLEGDDDFALSLSGALRHASSQVAGWDVSDREISLDQMMLAHGCDEPNVACMTDVAASLETDKVVYGTVRRASSGGDYDFTVTVNLFSRANNQVEESITDTIPRVRSDIDHLRARVRRYAERLAGEVASGSVVVAANVDGAEVFVDGDSLGFISGGELRAELPAGDREIEVRADGYATQSDTVSVPPNGEAMLELVLEEGESQGPEIGGSVSTGGGLSQTDLGFIFIGGAGLGLIISSIAGYILDGIGDYNGIDFRDNDTQVQAYREFVGRDTGDFCAAAEDDMRNDAMMSHDLDYIVDKCGTASTMNAVWWIGIMAAAALGGVGAFFILTDDGDADQEAHPADSGLVLSPVFDQHRAGLNAALRF